MASSKDAGLRQFFLAHLKSGRRYVSMPSQVADGLWHEFILFTKNYDALWVAAAAATSDARVEMPRVAKRRRRAIASAPSPAWRAP